MKKDFRQVTKTVAFVAATTVVSLCQVTHAQVERFTVSLGSQQKFVKALPVIAKLTFSVPAEKVDTTPRIGFRSAFYAPVTTLFSQNANIRVVFTHQVTGEKYSINSTRGQNITLSDSAGRTMSGERLFDTPIIEGNTQTMLIDLSSLRPEIHIGDAWILSRIPSGEYSMRFEIPGTNTSSNTVPITLVDASPQEQDWVRQVTEIVSPENERTFFSWVEILKAASKAAPTLSLASLQKLNAEAAKQLSFHAFMTAFLVSDNSTQTRKALEKFPVPAYLEVQKESLLLERDIMSSKTENDALKTRAQQFLKLHPEVQWRIEKARKGEAEFSPYLQPAP